ncbi:MAG: hypothetical protein HQL31_10400 [Planctomycetes bacterium]|nr:hypothetical protein [Planctomycetota bacterium]
MDLMKGHSRNLEAVGSKTSMLVHKADKKSSVDALASSEPEKEIKPSGQDIEAPVEVTQVVSLQQSDTTPKTVFPPSLPSAPDKTPDPQAPTGAYQTPAYEPTPEPPFEEELQRVAAIKPIDLADTGGDLGPLLNSLDELDAQEHVPDEALVGEAARELGNPVVTHAGPAVKDGELPDPLQKIQAEIVEDALSYEEPEIDSEIPNKDHEISVIPSDAVASANAPVLEVENRQNWIDNESEFGKYFREGFLEAMEDGDLVFNSRRANAWVGREYTLLLVPDAIRKIYGKRYNAISQLPEMQALDLDKQYDLCIYDGLKDLGVVFTGKDTCKPMSIWSCRFKPNDGYGFFSMKETQAFINFTIVRNDWLWKGIESLRPKIYPAEVVLGRKIVMKEEGRKRILWEPAVNFPFVPDSRRDSEIKRSRERADLRNRGGQLVPWEFSRKSADWLVDEIIENAKRGLVEINAYGCQYYADHQILAVVFPRVISVMGALNKYRDIGWPADHDMLLMANELFINMINNEKLLRHDHKVQRSFRVLGLNSELDPIELRGLLFDKKAIGLGPVLHEEMLEIRVVR